MYRLLFLSLLFVVGIVAAPFSAPQTPAVAPTATEALPPTLPPACTYVPRVPCLTPGPVTPGPDIPPTLPPAPPSRNQRAYLPLIRR